MCNRVLGMHFLSVLGCFGSGAGLGTHGFILLTKKKATPQHQESGADPGFWSGGGPSGVLTPGGLAEPKI